MRMGIIAVLHTFGADLKFYPHIHLLVTAGGMSLAGNQWISTPANFLMPHIGLKRRWRYWVTRLLKGCSSGGEISVCQTYRGIETLPHVCWTVEQAL